jgi:hypothetical protein
LAEFQRYVADVKWNVEAQMDALRNDQSNEHKNSLQHADMPDNIDDFVKICSKHELQIRARAAQMKSGCREGSYKKPDNANDTTSAPEASPARTVAGYHSPNSMDLSAVKEGKITSEKRKRRREEGLYMYCGDSRHFAASCPRKLKVVSGQVEINTLKENLGKENQDEGKGKEVELGKD